MDINVILTVGGLIGALIHIIVKVADINKRLATTNYRQVFYEYWKTDWPSFLLSLAVIAGVVFISSEWLNIKETDNIPVTFSEMLQAKIAQFAKTVSLIMGYCTDSAVAAFLGGTEKKLIKKAKEDGWSMEEIIQQKPTKNEETT